MHRGGGVSVSIAILSYLHGSRYTCAVEDTEPFILGYKPIVIFVSLEKIFPQLEKYFVRKYSISGVGTGSLVKLFILI